MAEPLKNVYNKAYIQRLAKELNQAGLSFDQLAFTKKLLAAPWKELELKARTTKICQALYQVLPKDYEEACNILIKAGKSFGGYEGMFFPEYVSTYGLDHWNTSLKTLEILTTYSSAEFAIRAFIEKDPTKAMDQMLIWSESPDEHVRRLASEGARPLLPWASQLSLFRKDPSLCLKVLENLKEDESLYVRKSVANHLNDISKDHPALALKVARQWVKSKHPHTLWIVKHGLRTLLKEGNQKALSLFGYAKRSSFQCNSFALDKQLVHLDEHLTLSFSFEVKKKGCFRFEYALSFLKANGSYTKKVFKISEKELNTGIHSLEKTHHFKPINTRKYYDGLHFIEFIINGISLEKKAFVLWLNKSSYHTYMIETKRGTIYTGVTTDINRRFDEHLSGKKGAKYTKANSPKHLIYLAPSSNRSEAQKWEAANKKLSRKEKESLSWLDTLARHLNS